MERSGENQESAKSPTADQISLGQQYVSPAGRQTSLLPRLEEMRVCKDRGGRKRTKSKRGEVERRRESPVQGAPASCHPGDGPDIASPLSSERKTQTDKGCL